MSQIPCRECQRGVLPEAVTCPHCGVLAPAGEARHCTYCHGELTVGALRCARCGGPATALPGAPPRTPRRWPVVVGGGVVLVVGFVIAVAWLGPRSPDRSTNATANAASIGLDCSLTNPAMGAFTPEDALGASTAAARGDRPNLNRLIRGRRVQVVYGGPRARITGIGIHTLKVVVLAGPSRGRELWVSDLYCQ